REYGFESWAKLKHHVETLGQRAAPEIRPAAPAPQGVADRYANLAQDLVAAHESGDAAAIQRLNEHHGRAFTWDDVRAEVWHNVYKVRQAGGRPGSFAIEDAQWLMARQAGFGNWTAFLNAVAAGTPPLGEVYMVDPKENAIAPRRKLSGKDWDAVLAV